MFIKLLGLQDDTEQATEDSNIPDSLPDIANGELDKPLEDVNQCPDCESNDENVKTASLGFIEIMDIWTLHLIEITKEVVPEWLHKSFHGQYVEGVSPRLVILLSVLSMTLISLHIIQLIADKSSREKPLLAKIASLDKALFKARNNEQLVRKELDEARSKLSFKETAASSTDDFTTTTVVDSITSESPSRSHFYQPPTQLVKEMESLKAEKSRVEKENCTISLQNKDVIQRLETKSQEVCNLQSQLDQTTHELKEAESMVKEVLEKERDRQQSGANQEVLIKSIDTLRSQLENQKKSVQKYESKISKRESELKGKVQEIRKLRADAANANLAVDKITAERDTMGKTIEQQEQQKEEIKNEMKRLEEQLVLFSETKHELAAVEEALDNKDSELEVKCREVEVLKETLRTLTVDDVNIVGNTEKEGNNRSCNTNGHKIASPESGDAPRTTNFKSKEDGGDRNKDEENGDGWDNQSFDGFGDEDDGKNELELDSANSEQAKSKGLLRSSSQVDARMLAAVQEMSQYKVDLSKSTKACELLSDQLTLAEKEKADISCKLSDNEKELKVARAAKDEALRVKLEIEQKHEVLTNYYNQREAELQKQLGLLSAKLGDAEEGSESTSKKLTHLFEELESYKSQCKSYKSEMEEQERSLKAQNAALEKRHHESWVTVRQESRKMADAQVMSKHKIEWANN